MYKHLIRPFLFRMNPERAHIFTLEMLRRVQKGMLARSFIRLLYGKEYPSLEREVFGLRFPSPVGLAGGLDKNGDYYNNLGDFGFSFVEIGSLTPQPQDGRPKPRLFRLPKDKALINRMGINNKGIMHAISNLKADRPRGLVAANIAKNSSSQGIQVVKDYVQAFTMMYDFVDFFVVNISCPNVEGLTSLQDVSYLSDIMDELLDKRVGMDVYKPVLLKLSPDLDHESLDEILSYAMNSGIDGIVAGNTSRSRNGLTAPQEKIKAIGEGGLSGAPLYPKSLEMVRYIHEKTAGRLPIVGCGGIMSPRQAQEMLDAGASLIEIYSGFVYEGPALVQRIKKHLANQK